MDKHSHFSIWLNQFDETNVQRVIAFMCAIRVHAGRAWIRLDRPMLGMPPLILGV